MATYTYVQLTPKCVPKMPTAHRTHTDGANHITEIWYAPYACRVMKMLYQVTETIVNDTIAAVIALGHGTRAGALDSDISETLTTLADGLAAADTIHEVEIEGGAAVTAGDSVVCQVHTAGTDTGGVAGIVRIWAVIQPAEM